MKAQISLPKIPESPPPFTAHHHHDPKAMLATLHAAGFKQAKSVPGLGFVVSPCGMLIPFERVARIQQALDRAKGDKHSRSYIFPIDWYVATPQAAADVKVFVSPMNPVWADLIRDALNEWNNAGPRSGVHLRFVEETEADTTVYLYSEENGYLGSADMPENGKVGQFLLINAFYHAIYGDTYYKNTIVHEMGHALGLAHSGGEDPSFRDPDRHIPGTSPEIDPRAVMRSEGHPWYGWSADELIAIAYLFPAPDIEEPHVFTEDLTTFDHGDWNGWERGSQAAHLQLNEDASGNFYLHTTTNGAMHGPILSKTFFGLTPGVTYLISAKVKRYDLGGMIPEFSFAHGNRRFLTVAVDSPEWTTIGHTFTASDDNRLVLECRFVQDPNHQGRYSNIAVDHLLVRRLVNEVTGFEPVDPPRDPWGGWQLNPATATGVSLQALPKPGAPDNWVVNFPTHGSSGNAGVVLTKRFKVFPGMRYKFSAQVRRTSVYANSGVPVLSLAIAGEAITEPFSLPRDEVWRHLESAWLAPANGPDEVEFSVVSHTSTGMGNDYVVDDLGVVEVPPEA